jgi:transcriptional regulator with XRE-family HTH domain
MNTTIGDNIRKIRMLKNIDAKTLADKLGISVSAFTKIERGETQVDMDRITRIAETLQVDPVDITSFNPDRFFFEKVEHSQIAGNNFEIENNSYYSIPKEILDTLTEQLKTANELIKEQQKIITKLLG